VNKRLANARRILAAQAELDRLAAWRLVDIERQAAGLDERRVALVCFLDAEASFGGPFAGAMMRRLEALEATRASLKLEQAALAEGRRAERARRRCAGAIVKTLEENERRRREGLQLVEAIEAALNRRAQGSGKLDGSS
jgi:1-acyl-sn-glycerol-3-phosphate acyltransferase